jgi:hypothetical protein
VATEMALHVLAYNITRVRHEHLRGEATPGGNPSMRAASPR